VARRRAGWTGAASGRRYLEEIQASCAP
jgi:hypothetical protein